jgi:NAD+ kinase
MTVAKHEDPLDYLDPAGRELLLIGLVVHPSRAIDRPLATLRQWTARHGVELVQIRASCQQESVAPPGEADHCDLIVSIGGDGTMLAATRAAAEAGRPVLGVACGSLGVLTSVAAGELERALERFSRGEWLARSLPALDVARDPGERLIALNDIAIVRTAGGQVRLTVHVDETLFARIAGDGCIVSTAAGSSAYALAAGGALLMPGTEAFVLTPLPTHGGSCPPLVVPAASQIVIDVMRGQGGARLEVDGQIASTDVGRLEISLREGVAKLVAFDDQEPFLAGLRRREIIADSPRILADSASRGEHRSTSR